MRKAYRFTKQEYAHKYDEHADSLYRFALCVTGDKMTAGAAMAELFSEGYFSQEDENFQTHMLKVLWRILESFPLSTGESYRAGMQRLFPGGGHAEMVEALCGLSPRERARLMLRTLFLRGDDAIAGILSHRPNDDHEFYFFCESLTARAS